MAKHQSLCWMVYQDPAHRFNPPPPLRSIFTYLPPDLHSICSSRLQDRPAKQKLHVGCMLDLLIEPDPSVAAAALRRCDRFELLTPLYAKPEFRPDYEGGLPRSGLKLKKKHIAGGATRRRSTTAGANPRSSPITQIIANIARTDNIRVSMYLVLGDALVYPA